MTIYEQWRTVKRECPDHLLFILDNSTAHAYDDDARTIAQLNILPLVKQRRAEVVALSGEFGGVTQRLQQAGWRIVVMRADREADDD